MTDAPKRIHRGRQSRIQQLPPAIKTRLDDLLRSGISQKAILDRLKPLLEKAGERPVSQAGLSRYATRMETVGRRIREARAVADACVGKLGQSHSNVGAYTIEMLRTLVNDLVLKFHEAGEVGADELKTVSITLQRIEKASNLNVAHLRAVRQEVAAAAAEAAGGEARRRGVSAETAAAIRQVIEGVAAS